jgi:CobQ-like glutamine amidotransferase family enzyme
MIRPEDLARDHAVAAAARPLRVVTVYPDLLGTYGDGGNALVLARRAQWRGLKVEWVEAMSDAPLPAADLYCIGGGEDGPQARAVEALQADGRLALAFAEGAVVLAVCAGFQIVGRSFPAADGQPLAGLGLIDVETRRGAKRAVGEVVAEPDDVGLPVLTGFENHAGVTHVGPAARPLGRVRAGVGNGDGTEGAICGRLIGTYLHGPVLARNPALADLLLRWATAADQLSHLDDHREHALRVERLRSGRQRSFSLHGRPRPPR